MMRPDPILHPAARSGPVGRYAPSPTGDLHLGNLRTALVAFEDCRRLGGTFIMRIEDIDTPRTVAGSEERMLDDLRWLGIDWDEGPEAGGPAGPYRQSERGEIYAEALARLEAQGLTYLCTCSRKDLREASAPHPSQRTHDSDGSGDSDGPDDSEGPVYPGTCRSSDPEAQRRHAAGAAVRFRIDGPASSDRRVDDNGRPMHEIEFTDAEAGPQSFDLAALCGDFIIRRRDGLWAYQFACAVDDALMGVTHVVRGADLLSSTPRQIAIVRALGLAEPRYRHVPLVVDAAGARMSKRDGSSSLRELRNSGISPAEARRKIMQMPTAGR